MKTRILFATVFAAFTFMFIACEQENITPDDQQNNTENIIPEKFGVDIPNAISQAHTKAATLKSGTEETPISGADIYGNLNYFIAIGEGAAQLVQDIIYGIRLHNIQSVIEVTYTSDDDSRIKRLVVEQNVEFDSRTWEYMLTVTDLESEGDDDGGKAMQVFWNPNPIEGIAILNPYNIDRRNAEDEGAIFSVEYSALGNEMYEEFMIVDIMNLPNDNSADVFAVDNIKMFVGKNGDYVDVYGNSNHPEATFNPYNEHVGYNWAFVASGKTEADIAVAEVGLPYSSEDATSREVLLVDNSIHNVLSRELTNYWVSYFAEQGLTLDSTEVAAYLAPSLVNAVAPGYFDANGFVQGGTAPNDAYTDIENRITDLVPFSPVNISNLMVSFK